MKAVWQQASKQTNGQTIFQRSFQRTFPFAYPVSSSSKIKTNKKLLILCYLPKQQQAAKDKTRCCIRQLYQELFNSRLWSFFFAISLFGMSNDNCIKIRPVSLLFLFKRVKILYVLFTYTPPLAVYFLKSCSSFNFFQSHQQDRCMWPYAVVASKYVLRYYL